MIPTHFQEVETLYRCIRQSGAKVFAVTSPASGQGTSTLAYAAACRCAKAGSMVLLVELRTQKSCLNDTLAIPRQAWLPNAGEASRAMTAIDKGRLSLLPAPQHKTLPQGFREPDTLADLVAEWRSVFDFVFVETAPLNATNRQEIGPVMAMRVAERVIVSVMPRQTTHQELQHAVNQVQLANTELLGAVVNDRHNPLLIDEIRRQIYRAVPLGPLRMTLNRWIENIPLLQQLP